MIRAIAILSTLMLLWASLARSQPSGTLIAPGAAGTEPPWAASVARGEAVDFDATCASPSTAWPQQPDECRCISAALLQKLLIKEDKTDLLSSKGIRLNGAVIDGDLVLQDAQVARSFAITGSVITGKVDFSRSHFTSGLSLSRSSIGDDFIGSGMSVGGDLELENTVVGRKINLIGATIDGFGHFNQLKARQLVMDSSHFRHDLVVDNATLIYDPKIEPCVDPRAVLCGHLMRVDGQLSISGPKVPDNIFLADSEVHGDLKIGGVSGTLNLDSILVGGTAHMEQSDAEYGEINLAAAEIDHYLIVQRARHVKYLKAENLHVRQKAAIEGNIARFDLPGARFDASMEVTLTPGTDHQPMRADFSNMHVANTLKMNCRAACSLVFRFLNVGGDLNLAGSTLALLDLSQARIGGNLDISRVKWSPRPEVAHSPEPKVLLSVNNAQVAAVVGEPEAWPAKKTDLYGFVYSDLPSFKDDAMRKDWLDRDLDYGPQAYIHLASVLTTQGDRDGAAEIQYAAREQDLSTAWHQGRYGTAILLFTLRWLGNYGIGNKTWWCIVPILVLSASGAFVISTVPGARSHGLPWLFGAGLHNLLPYRPIDHTISDFLDRQEGFRAWHKLLLFLFALIGIVLALFLAAAAAGLTQRG